MRNYCQCDHNCYLTPNGIHFCFMISELKTVSESLSNHLGSLRGYSVPKRVRHPEYKWRSKTRYTKCRCTGRMSPPCGKKAPIELLSPSAYYGLCGSIHPRTVLPLVIFLPSPSLKNFRDYYEKEVNPCSIPLPDFVLIQHLTIERPKSEISLRLNQQLCTRPLPMLPNIPG